MKRNIIIASILLLFSFSVLSQNKVLSKEDLTYNYIFKEKIFVNVNSSLLLVGDNLLYTIFCMSDRYNKPSIYSKVAYIELINSEKKNVFKHKIRLNKGIGDGSFFLPTSLKSGTYKLISYTQAMRNEGKEYFYQTDIGIINPFESLDSTNVEIVDAANTVNHISNKNNGIEINTSSTNYTSRSKVDLIIKKPSSTGIAYLNVSVRKIDNLPKPKLLKTNDYEAIYPLTDKKIYKDKKIEFLPEFKGELISGKVLNMENNLPVENVQLALSIPEEEFILKFANTDANGVFIFNIETKIASNDAFIQVLNDHKTNYKIDLDESSPINYENLVFTKLALPSNNKIKKILEEYSLYNQVENAYKPLKLDAARKEEETYLANYKTKETKEVIFLDDYKRFPTIKETIVEIVPNVWISKKDGKQLFNIRKLNAYQKENYSPLVLVDGILVQDYDKLVGYDATNIKKINIIRNNFSLENSTFQGIINFETFNKNYHKARNNNYEKYFDILNSVQKREYFKQTYTEEIKNNRLPDYRTQLFWKPNFVLKTNQKKLDFYTSDVKGDFEINIEGFYEDGTPISLRSKIAVE